MDTVSIGKTIIDDYTAACRQQSSSNQTTLSLIDLAELSGTVPEAFNKFASSTVELIDSDSYTVVSNARSRAKEFSSGINQIDLINFADNMGTPEAKALSEALRGCIKYNRVSKSLANANGISIYFPYRKLSSMNSMVDIYDEIGMDDAYTNCIRSFASVAAGGQLTSSSSRLPPHLPVRGYERQRQQRRYAFRAALRGAFRQRQLLLRQQLLFRRLQLFRPVTICSRACAR